VETKIIGHRGGVDGYPENTLANFKKAVELGADGVEFDVQLSKDGQIVVIHDELIDRTMSGTGLVKDHTLAELQEMSVTKNFGPEFKTERIPTLQEVLTVVKDLEFINIELKNFLPYHNLEEKVLAVVAEFNLQAKTILSSFNHYSLQKIKKLQPEMRVGALLAAKLINPTEYAFKRGFDALHLNFLTADEEIVKKAHFMGLELNVYTVNHPTAMIELFERDIDHLITDNIELAFEMKNI
jgi:glycerophosphoryl diester phosphodiesterase